MVPRGMPRLMVASRDVILRVLHECPGRSEYWQRLRNRHWQRLHHRQFQRLGHGVRLHHQPNRGKGRGVRMVVALPRLASSTPCTISRRRPVHCRKFCISSIVSALRTLKY